MRTPIRDNATAFPSAKIFVFILCVLLAQAFSILVLAAIEM
jgi:hypothetical protein